MNDYQKRQAERKEWLDSLKPGDEVVAYGYGIYRRKEITTVVRRTRTQIIISKKPFNYETRIRCSDGREVGNRLSGIEKPTDQMREQINAQSRRYRLAVLTKEIRSFTDEQVSAMLEAYDRVKETDKAA